MDVSLRRNHSPPLIAVTVNGYSIAAAVQGSISRNLLPPELVLNPDLEFTIQMRSIRYFSVNDLAFDVGREQNRCLRAGELRKGR